MTQKSKFTKEKTDKSNYIRTEIFFVAKIKYYQPSQDKKVNDKLGGSISNIQGNISNFLTFKRFLTLKTEVNSSTERWSKDTDSYSQKKKYKKKKI